MVLTRGDRASSLVTAIRSLLDADVEPADVIVVVNAPDVRVDVPEGVRVIRQAQNLGVPGGRDVGLRAAGSDLVGFLDDDAELLGPLRPAIDHFERSPLCAAVSLRLVDESGSSARRHIPRRGGRGADRSGPVVGFLGGASIVRRRAYLNSGGYWCSLFYGHEELELSWRLIDRGWSIDYLADVTVFHPRTSIGRHEEGWRLTGKNRVLIARRTLPIPVSWVHAAVWLAIGLWRAPASSSKAAYAVGWSKGWRQDIRRRPIRWRTLVVLRRLGRFPIA